MRRGALTRERDVREAYSAHSGELYGLALRVLGDSGLAEEAVQETFLRAWRDSDRVDPASDTLRSRLFATLREVAIDLGVEAPEQTLLAWQIEEAMRRIDDHHREVLVETYYRSRPYAEVATELGVPESAMKSRVYEGMRALHLALAEVEFEG